MATERGYPSRVSLFLLSYGCVSPGRIGLGCPRATLRLAMIIVVRVRISVTCMVMTKVVIGFRLSRGSVITYLAVSSAVITAKRTVGRTEPRQAARTIVPQWALITNGLDESARKSADRRPPG